MADGDPKSVSEVIRRVGVSRSQFYEWRKLPEFPTDAGLAEQMAWAKAKKGGTLPDDVKENENGKSYTDWRKEKQKWDAIEKRQKVESERLKIVMEAREQVTGGVVAVLARVRDDVAAIIDNDPDKARQINAIYDKAIEELTNGGTD